MYRRGANSPTRGASRQPAAVERVRPFSGSRGDVISLIFKVAGYTYGPLLGLYLVGMFTQIQVKDKWVPLICIIAPLATYGLSVFVKNSFNFDFGFISIAVNAILTILGLLALTKKSNE